MIVRVGVNSFLISILLKDRLQILLKNQNKLSELIPLYSLEIAVKFGMIPNLLLQISASYGKYLYLSRNADTGNYLLNIKIISEKPCTTSPENASNTIWYFTGVRKNICK